MRRVEIVARFADDADERPEMDEVLALLDRVPADSVDAPAAAELKGRILENRRRLEARAAERRRAVEAAGRPADWVAPSGEGGGAAGAARPAIAAGMKLDDFKAAYGDCFEWKTEIQIQRGDGGVLAPRGEAWGLKRDPACKERHAAQADQVVLFANGSLVTVRPASEVTRTEIQEQVTTRREVWGTRLPDGGIQVLDGGPAAMPTAGEAR